MRIGILSDIHGNLEALEATLKCLESEDVERLLCLGDIVGYGADPQACLDRIRETGADIVAGNHDFAVAGRVDTSYFNEHAKRAVEWTREQLRQDSVEFLSALPLVHQGPGFLGVHATLDEPEAFDYVQSLEEAAALLARQTEPVCVYGHTHVPIAFKQRGLTTEVTFEPTIRAEEDESILVNVGSVGQPRDEDPRACYAVFDSERLEVEIHRVTYDVPTAIQKIQRASLPPVLAERLNYGL